MRSSMTNSLGLALVWVAISSLAAAAQAQDHVTYQPVRPTYLLVLSGMSAEVEDNRPSSISAIGRNGWPGTGRPPHS